jgi:hypothetical protein
MKNRRSCHVLIRCDFSRPVLKITQSVLIEYENFLLYLILQQHTN